MVFFTCDLCGECLKKKQVQQHFYRCKSTTYSCMDCQTTYDRKTYNDHLKCISENEKYGGASYVAKPNKGELKQDNWVQQVRMAIKSVKEPKLKGVLRSIQAHSNIPRKEAKFINFLQNSMRIKNKELCQEAWNAIKNAIATKSVEEKTATKSGEGNTAEDVQQQEQDL